MTHQFHIPVLGLGFSIDTPLKVARYGISSVVSIVDDELIERMRAYHSQQAGQPYVPISKNEPDFRARRITAYLDLLHGLIEKQMQELKMQQFEPDTDLTRYFQLLPDYLQLKQGYELMMQYPEGESRTIFKKRLKALMMPGSIDVNIMAKVDKVNFTKEGDPLGELETDALAALRGYAQSRLSSSLTLSAGMNPRLYSYLEEFPDFFPDEQGHFKKKIVLKVSDYRSAYIQARFLAKKGLWVSEFRIESGLNCGGHAFATEGLLMGPILEEFKQHRGDLKALLFESYEKALRTKSRSVSKVPEQRITVQGGIGTSEEKDFLIRHYDVDATGWGSPFLLVPEVTNVDEETLTLLTTSRESDFYLSNASPLGILFNNFRGSSIDHQREERIAKGRPGSPCVKKYLCSNTEFTEQPICTASREYQHLKIKQLETMELSKEALSAEIATVTEKTCLCEGLCASAYLKTGILKPKESKAVAICPGPNLAYFKERYSLEQMVNHIYGRTNLLEQVKRPHFLIKELNLYIDYFQKELQLYVKQINEKKEKQLARFRQQLFEGIAYYKTLFEELSFPDFVQEELSSSELKLKALRW